MPIERDVFSAKKALLLDMNGTFMFGEDNFGLSEDFSVHYRQIGGALLSDNINQIIRSIYAYLEKRYPLEKYRHDFPSIKNVITNVLRLDLKDDEVDNIVATFASYEIGFIPDEYIDVLHKLSKKFMLAVVIDIWAQKRLGWQCLRKRELPTCLWHHHSLLIMEWLSHPRGQCRWLLRNWALRNIMQ